MSERPKKPLAILEEKTRQLMLMIGFGFIAFVGGSLLSASLIMRVRDRVIAADSAVLAFGVQVLLGRLWILVVFPLLVNLVSRFLDLPLWRTAILGALTGEVFYSLIQVASVGADQAFGDWLQNAVRAGTLVGGVILTVWAGKQGRAWSDQRQKVAEEAAKARKGQYDEFLAASTALADKRDAAAAAHAVPAIAPVEGVATAAPVAVPTEVGALPPVADGDGKPPA